jgi:hypothetical protein
LLAAASPPLRNTHRVLGYFVSPFLTCAFIPVLKNQNALTRQSLLPMCFVERLSAQTLMEQTQRLAWLILRDHLASSVVAAHAPPRVLGVSLQAEKSAILPSEHSLRIPLLPSKSAFPHSSSTNLFMDFCTFSQSPRIQNP